ncbi:hypothetical protein [Pseudomonas putida]|uniref:hypothetical protein n=1 Tax=Pseudomonas putida TaxID=303 RepID=UPI0039E1A7BD
MSISEHGAVAFLYGLNGRIVGQVIIDEWFGVDLGEEVTVAPREGGLFGLEQIDKPIVAGSGVLPRGRATKPWLRAKKGRSRQ